MSFGSHSCKRGLVYETQNNSHNNRLLDIRKLAKTLSCVLREAVPVPYNWFRNSFFQSHNFFDMLACRKCGNCDRDRLRLEKHIFKNNTFHIKLLCFECGAFMYIPRNKEAVRATFSQVWIRDHQKGARREREKEFRALRKKVQQNKSNVGRDKLDCCLR